MMYVVVLRGYEGIERIFWAGDNIEEAVQRVLDLRDEAIPLSTDQFDSDRLDNLSREELIEEYEHDYEADDICVMKESEEEKRFVCCCGILGVPPSENKLY